MPVQPGKPSPWLLKNSSGYPDFLFTTLTYSLILLAFVTFFWLGFGILAYKYAGTAAAETLLSVMNSLKNGLISLSGVVFGLAGSYTMRRFKRDEHTVELHNAGLQMQAPPTMSLPNTEPGLEIVNNEEDI